MAAVAVRAARTAGGPAPNVRQKNGAASRSASAVAALAAIMALPGAASMLGMASVVTAAASAARDTMATPPAKSRRASQPPRAASATAAARSIDATTRLGAAPATGGNTVAGDFIGTDVVATRHSYLAASTVGISDDDSPSVATDYPSPPANVSTHRWRVNLPSVAGQLAAAGKDWRAYLQNIPSSGTTLANWPGDSNTAKLYAVKHNPFPYVAEIQDSAAEFAKQVPIEQLFSDLGAKTVPAFSYIVPDQCRDMHGIGNPLAPCGGASSTDNNDIKRGDDEAFWLVNSITGSPGWKHGRNAIFVVFDEGNGPLSCPSYNPDTGTDAFPGTLLPGADCYDPKNFNDRVVMIVITNYGVKGVIDKLGVQR